VKEPDLEKFKKALMDLLRGTAIENDAVELARLSDLAPHKQLEVGFVLRAAMFEAKATTPGGTTELAEVRSVDAALHFLYPVGRYARH
jgi:hypothetical protein